MQHAPIDDARGADDDDDFPEAPDAVEVEDDEQRGHRSDQIEEHAIVEELGERPRCALGACSQPGARQCRRSRGGGGVRHGATAIASARKTRSSSSVSGWKWMRYTSNRTVGDGMVRAAAEGDPSPASVAN